MADVGVLNLQINANASQAATSLGELADALSRVKRAVGKGLSFGRFPSSLKSLREALGGDWSGAEKFSASMEKIKEGIKTLSSFGAASKMLDTANALNAMAKAVEKYQKVITEAGFNNTSNAQNSVRTATAGTTGRMASNLQQFGSSKSKGTSDGNVKDIENVKNAISQIDSGTISNIQSLVTSLKELKGLSDVGSSLKNIAEGISVLANAFKNSEALASAIRIDASALNRMKTVCEGLVLPNFDGLIKLAQSMKGNSDSSVYLKRVAESLEALKGGTLSDTAKGFGEIGNALKQLDAGTVENISAFASVLKELKGLGGIGSNLKRIGEGFSALNGSTKNAEALASAIRIDASAINRMKTVCDGFKLPSFNNLIKLAESMQANPAASVYLKRIADAIEALKASSSGLKLSNTSGIGNLISGINGAGNENSIATTNVQQMGDAIDETASKMQQFGSETNSTMSSVADNANKTADTIAQSIANALPDTMSWRIGENMIPATAQENNEAFESMKEESGAAMGYAKESVEEVKRELVEMQDAIENASGSFRRMIKVGEGPGAHLEWETVTPEANAARRAEALARSNDAQMRREAMWSATSANSSVPGMREYTASLLNIKDVAERTVGPIQNVNNAIANTGANSTPDISKPGSMSDTLSNIMNRQTSPAFEEIKRNEQDVKSETQELTSNLKELDQEVKQKKPDCEEAASGFAKFKGSLSEMKAGVKTLIKPLTNLGKQFYRIAKRMAIRAIIRQVTSAFREGTENMYRYSDAIGGGFASSMDSAATALNQMKNSVGAAVAPLIQMLIPTIQTVVGWITQAINYLNQFFALLSGNSTWTRALPVATKAFDEQKKAAKGASDSVKDMLADFDELNIIQQNGSGGGSGGSGSDTNYAEMFEEVNEFDGKIKDMVQWIQDHMETVEGIAKAIGIAILGWKVSKAFDGVLGTLGGIIAGGAILAIGLQVAFEGAYSAGLNGGFDTSSLLATIAGNVAAAVGGGIIGFKLAGPKGAAVGALIGLTIGIVTSIIAYKKGQNMAEEIARFGTIAMDAAQLKQSIQNMYSFDITPKIQLIGTTIENAEQAQNRLSADATLLSTKIKKVLIGVRVSGGAENELLELKKQCDQIIIDINDYLQNTAEGIHLLVQDVRIKDANGTDITDNILADVTESDRLIMSYMTKLGEEVAKAFDEGMKSGWANDEMDLMLANAERMARITTGSQELQLQMEYEVAQLDILSGVDLQNLDRDSMLELMSQLAQIEGEYTGKYVDLQKVSRSSMLNRASMLQRIAEDMDENDPLKEQYTAMAEKLQNDALALTESVMREAAYGKFGIGSKNQELRRAMAESLRGTYYSSNAWQRYIVDLLREYDAEDEAQTQRAYESAVQQVQTQLSSSTPNIDKIVEGINQIIVDSLGGASQDVIKGFEEAGGALIDILPSQTQQNLFQYLTERANNIFADAQDQKKFVDSVMLELYKGDKLRYAQLLESIGQSPWGMYGEALPKEFNGEEVDTTFLENIFADAAENLAASGLDLYDYVKDKYGSTTLATIVDAINKAVETTGQTRDEIYRLMFGDTPVPNVSGGLPPLANRLGPEGYRASNAGGPFGPASGRQMNAMQLVWNIEEGLKTAFGGENLTPGESNMFVQPSGYTEDTDDRTANATEAMQQDIVTQNDKIDRVERLLTAVLSRLNAGLNVNMAPTSTGGRMVNGMLDAFTRVTGNN